MRYAALQTKALFLVPMTEVYDFWWKEFIGILNANDTLFFETLYIVLIGKIASYL